ITKPYKLEEMLSRVRAAMRRRDMEAAKPVPSAVTRGPLTLDTLALQAFLDGKNLLLSPKEFALLRYFAQRERQLLSFEELYEAVWKMPLESDLAALQRMVSKLRAKLAGGGASSFEIQVVRGVGYEFAGV
ncbi:MAG: response regulator transcription factor, partial [Clostridiales Family XIII bacterium]|nr:response regulator transcription factor [Clostridiales Family XIII bacterium]